MLLNLNLSKVVVRRSQIFNGINVCKKLNVSSKIQRAPRDMIGSADPISNLLPVKYAVRENENDWEKKLRESREELQNWNQLFWTKHNKCFMKRKEEFERNLLKSKNLNDQVITANEISVFYKQFLDDNWEIHLRYLLMWYKKNAYVTLLSFYVLLQSMFKKT